MAITAQTLLKRHIALTNEHGSWALFLSPLLIGLAAGGELTAASLYFALAALSVFLLRHPVTILVKLASGRRPRRDLPAAAFWTGIYALSGLGMAYVLLSQGFGYILLLAIPALLIFCWQLILVGRRAERKHLGVELAGSGVLALTAPAAMWVGKGEPVGIGWLLWILVWLQSAASIVYAYLRLEQRRLDSVPDLAERLRMGRRALGYSTINLLFVIALSLMEVLPALLFVPYALQWGETLWGIYNPAIGKRPTAIGLRQMAVSGLFTILFILTW